MRKPNKDGGETVFQSAGTILEQRRNSGTWGHPLGSRPQGGRIDGGREAEHDRDPMRQENQIAGQEQLVVELNSGRSYFVPREAVERLFLLCPDQAAAVVACVSPLRAPLDPSGLPSEAGEGLLGGVVKQQHKIAKWPRKKEPWVSCHALKGEG